MQKELALTKGWLKPKRLLEVTGKTAKEVLLAEAREKKKAGNKAGTGSTLEGRLSPNANQARPAVSAQKPPSVPVVKAKAASRITLQGLVEHYLPGELQRGAEHDAAAAKTAQQPGEHQDQKLGKMRSPSAARS